LCLRIRKRKSFAIFQRAGMYPKTPSGVQKVFRSSTNAGIVIPRVFKDDTPEDLKAVQAAIQGVMLYPLSQFDGKMKSKDWSTLPKFPSESEGQEETKWVVPDKFVETLPKVLDEVPSLAGEVLVR
jgi:hypothetical protein